MLGTPRLACDCFDDYAAVGHARSYADLGVPHAPFLDAKDVKALPAPQPPL